MSKDDGKTTAIAARLRLAREQAGLSQGQVAKLLGLHRPSISEAEAGRRRVSADELAAFARIYGVSASWIIGSDTEPSAAEHDRVALAARELSKLKSEDIDRLLHLLSTLRTNQGEDVE